MNKFSKKTTIGMITAGVAAATLAAGLATPAFATTGHDSSIKKVDTSNSQSTTSSRWMLDALHGFTTGANGGDTSTSAPVGISPSINVGDVASGNAVGSGDTLGSGNDGALLSGNDSAVGNNDSTGAVNSDVSKLVNGILSGNSASGSSSSSSHKGGLDLTNLLGSDDR